MEELAGCFAAAKAVSPVRRLLITPCGQGVIRPGVPGLRPSLCPEVPVSEPGIRGSRHTFEAISHATLGACIDVQRQLGLHCMEVDYQRALEVALPEHGLDFYRELEIPLYYKGTMVSKRRVDFVIWEAGSPPAGSAHSSELLLETKARSLILPEDVEQCLLYLHQGGYQLCLLVNFGQKPLGIRRLVHTPTMEQRG